MISINKNEAIMLRAINPDVVIRRTMKQKSKRHKYFVEESSWVLTAVKKYRNKVERGEKFNG
jgi:hypothetical protein